MNVSQLMHGNLITCRPEDSLAVAAGKMWDHDIGFVPIVDDANHVVGVITDRDACMAAYTQGQPLHTIRVDAAMARPAFTASPADRIEDVEVVMRRYRVRRVPVVDGEGCLLGVITINDLAREAAAELNRSQPDVADGELVSTLACICQPRHAPAAPFASSSPPPP